ncbi:class I SAM-dependent RNA methyltransferase [Candidatus Saccharibacteria bacterium]|nr:class I SAM-dependent RNA methyltransferase [Candidatus Saccharibacteria bacterium]
MLKIEKFIPGGLALGTIHDSSSRDNGKKVMLWNALPGETISDFRITKRKSSFFEGVAEKIENPSPFRVEPNDSCFLSTSPWQILDFSYELDLKRLLVEESLHEEHISLPEGVEVEPVRTDGVEWFYRNKMEYALYFDKEKEKIFPAFHLRGTHQKLPVEKSSIERPEIFQKAKEIISDLNARNEPAYKFQSLLLRANAFGEVSGGLFENHAPHPIFRKLSDEILGKTYSYSPNGFFQINLPVYELALKEIKENLADARKVLDLYSGVGTIGLSVASDRELTLVECNKDAFRELEENTKGTSARPVLAKSEEALEFIVSDETVILDPPRAGCDKKLVEKLLEVLPEKIIYLSCNPSTQARDVRLLTAEGKYIIKKVVPFNFFPKTPHIENLIVLARA